MSESSYEVGYRRPPRHTRFQKGRSGNPAGRPKGNPSLRSELAAELFASITVKEQGRSIKITKMQALLKSIYARAISGDAKSMACLLDMVARLGLLDPPASHNDNADSGAPEDTAILAAYIRRKSGGGHDG